MTALLTRCKAPFESLSSSAIESVIRNLVRTTWAREFLKLRAAC